MFPPAFRWTLLVVLFFINRCYSHGPAVDVDAFHQGLNIQITGIPNAAATADGCECPGQYCKVGKAGPQGRHGQKEEKGDAAEACECITNQQLLDKINSLETLLHTIVSKTTRDCQDIHAYFSLQSSGVRTITPSSSETQVYCELDEDEEIWTVIQRRLDGSEDFYRGLSDYKSGFGNKNSEYWLGLDNIHALTRGNEYELKIDVENWEGVKKFALYTTFEVGNEASDYQLTVGGYSGDAGDSLAYHNGGRFGTKDHDVDTHGSENCASYYKGAWWYKACHYSNLNGFYFKGGSTSPQGVDWRKFYQPAKHYSQKRVAMKIKRKI